MTDRTPTLYILSGKIAAGKSTLAAELASRPVTVLLDEDDLLSTLYPEEVKSLDDYVRYSNRIRNAIRPHIIALLGEDISVVMDFPANTPGQRRWLKGIVEEANVREELHYLDVSDEVCKARLRKRNDAGEHAFRVGDADFDLFTSYFVPPTEDEGFTIIFHQV